MDDFEASLAGLLKLCKQQQEYVQQHTYFLAKALEWEQHQKQSRYLLIGDERKQAEAWLNIRFKDEQAPCLPTDLHCELITESIKNGNNLMTQVFLAHAEVDAAVMEQIRKSLRRECFTVWTNKTDIQTGEAFEDAIKRGIEQADNVVYLLSPDSLKTDYCQQELEYALSLNKRIIPILVRETPPAQVPPTLRNLQYIDLSDNLKEEDYSLDESQLLKILRQDAAYYNEHKMLLTKALKWERQHRNSSILLRGYNLHSAEAWLKVAQSRNQYLPTALQEEFIAESLRQPAAVSLDVFVSYSRTDSDFARKLNDQLQMQGKTTWFDQESIASGADFQQEIDRGIESSNNFLFILSPRSVNSPYCAGEVEYAAKLNKRFVTVLYRQVNPADLHPELAKMQWIDFNQNERDFNANFSRLLRTLDTDREYVNSHTKWSQRSLEWQEKGKSKDLLLRGNELAIAQNWLQEAEQNHKKPAITDLQKDYIRHTQQARDAGVKQEKQRVVILRSLLGLMSVAFVGAVVVSVFAWNEQNRAEKSLGEQVDALSRYSKTLSDSNQEFDALIEAIRAGKLLLQHHNTSPKSKKSVEEVLRRALNGVKERDRIEGQTTVNVSPDHKTIATINKDGTAWLWDFQGKALCTPLRHDPEEITSIFFSDKDGKTIATLSKKTIKLWDKHGKERGTLSFQKEISSVIVSSDGNKIATYSSSEDNLTVKLWNVESHKLTPFLPKEKFNDIDFSSDGKLIATLIEDGDNQIVKIWNQNGEELQTLHPRTLVDTVYFSSEGNTLATVSPNYTIKLWNIENSDRQILAGHDASVDTVEFSPKDGKLIATMSGDGSTGMVKLWRREGDKVKPFNFSPTNEKVNNLEFSPDSHLIATYSGEGDNQTVKLWSREGDKITPFNLFPTNENFNNVSFSEDGKLIATYSGKQDNQTVKLWNREGDKITPFNLFPTNENFNNVSFSEDGKLIATYSGKQDNQTVKLWSLEGKQFQPLLSNEKFNNVSFSKDGKLIATYSGKQDNQTVKLWNLKGKQFQPWLSNEKFNNVSFSEDGKLIATFPKASDTKASDSKRVNSGSSDDQPVKLWSREGKEIASFPSKEHFNNLEFSPDGKLIATTNDNNYSSKLWKLADQKLQPLQDGEFNEKAFSPDSKLIATANNNNNTVQIWNQEGEELANLNFNNSINSLSFSPDGKILAIASSDKKVFLWHMKRDEWESLAQTELEKLVKKACEVVGNYLEHKPKDDNDRLLCEDIG